MEKSTKYCELKVYLRNGHWMTGLFHVSSRTSSTIRPSDAISEKNNGLLLMSDVTIHEGGDSRKVPAIMVPFGAIAHIELPFSWIPKPDSDSSEEQNALVGVHSAPSAAPNPALVTVRRTPLPKWRGGT